jgi:hypothetical protein
VDAARGFEVELHQVGVTGRAQDAASRERALLRQPLVAWLLVLISIAGTAAVGRLVGPGPETRPAAVNRPVTAAVDPANPAPVTAAAVAPMPEIIVLSSPAAANATITTRQLTIRGYLATGGGTIQVTLEARGNRIIDSATIEPTLVFGERPTVGRHAQFETRFGLPNPRPNGRMIVQIALLDPSGRIVDVIRRPIRVGPLLEGTGV